MKIKNSILAFVALIGLASCSNPGEYTIRTISPTGAPTIALYDKGLDTTNYVTESGAIVLAQFQNNEYDAIIYDATTALSQLKNYTTDYKFVKLITGGNLYLTSINKEEGAMPQEGDTIVGFQKQSVPGKVFDKLLKDYWGINNTVEWVKDASAAKSVLENNLYNGEPVDFVLMAQPALQVTLAASASFSHSIKVVKNIRTEWKAYTGQEFTPQAGLFVKQSAYDAHKDKFEEYFNQIDTNLTTALNDPAAVKAKIDEQYPVAQNQGARYGYPAAIMLKVQENGKNGFGVVDPNITYGRTQVNEFLATFGEAPIGEEYFLRK